MSLRDQWLTIDLFGAHVQGRPHRDAGLRERRALLQVVRPAEIGDFGFALFVSKMFPGDIAMDNPVFAGHQ